MATYRNNNDEEIVYIPGEFKLNVNMAPIGDYHMEAVDFTCTFYTNNLRKVVLDKSDMIQIDANNYVAPLKSEDLGRGSVTVVYTADIPDDDFDDHLRKEVVVIRTGLRIK